MRGVRNAKRVSWATDGNLCQVRLFLSEDSPSQVGIGLQDHLQPKKKTSGLYCTGSVPDDALPPGFEVADTENQFLKNKLARFPRLKWRCPPRFMINTSWQVAAGESSEEVENQNKRELRALEAIYPRSSAVPPNPALSPSMENSINDDSGTPLVPITPIEEEEAVGEIIADPSPTGAYKVSFAPGYAQSSYSTSTSVLNPHDIGGVATLSSQPQLLAAASAALSALSSSNQPGKMIDQELLLKVLSNPAMLENLLKNHMNSSSSNRPMQVTPTAQAGSIVATMRDPPPHLPASFSQIDTSISSTTNGQFFPPAPNGSPLTLPYPHATPSPVTGGGLPSSSGTSIGAGPPKDINYYKSLILRHGEDRPLEAGPVPPFMGHHSNSTNQHNLDSMEHCRNRESKPRFMKPCLYFNSPKGCRHGANCAYQHDESMIQQQKVNGGGMLETQSAAKRMKTDNREMRGPPQSYS